AASESNVSEPSGSFTAPVAPPPQLVLIAQRLLPAKQEEAGKETQGQLGVEPALGVDAVRAQGSAEAANGILLRLRHPGPIHRYVPRELVATGSLAGVRPVDEDGTTVASGAQVAELPVAVHERQWRLPHPIDEPRWVASEGVDHV